MTYATSGHPAHGPYAVGLDKNAANHVALTPLTFLERSADVYPDRTAFVDRHGSGTDSLSTLRTVLTETRQRGYAVEDGEVTPGFASVAAPVLDHNGHPVAGLAVTFPTSTNGEPPTLPVRRAAEALTARLGGRGHRVS